MRIAIPVYIVAVLGVFAFGCSPNENESLGSSESGSGKSDPRVEQLLKSEFGGKYLERWRTGLVAGVVKTLAHSYRFTDSNSLTNEAGKKDNLPGVIELSREQVFDEEAKNYKEKNKPQDVVEKIDFRLKLATPDSLLTCWAQLTRFGKPIEGVTSFIQLKTAQKVSVNLVANTVNFWKWLEEAFVDTCVRDWRGGGAPSRFVLEQAKLRVKMSLTYFADRRSNRVDASSCADERGDKESSGDEKSYKYSFGPKTDSANCHSDILDYVRSRPKQ